MNPGAIRATMAAFRRWRLETNPFLSDLSAFSHVPSIALPALARVLNPVVQGTALQHHQVGGFGDQQHLWSALLDGGIPLFTTHPGLPLVENATRQRTPDRWVGNGINPDLGQHAGVLLARYDTRGRPGYGEGPRARHTHLHLPTDRLDECELGGTRLVGRAGRSLLAVLGTARSSCVGWPHRHRENAAAADGPSTPRCPRPARTSRAPRRRCCACPTPRSCSRDG